MVYIVGIIGFIAGFALGQLILYALLRHKSQEELLNDSYLKWTYGILNWGIAALVSYVCVNQYSYYAALYG